MSLSRVNLQGGGILKSERFEGRCWNFSGQGANAWYWATPHPPSLYNYPFLSRTWVIGSSGTNQQHSLLRYNPSTTGWLTWSIPVVWNLPIPEIFSWTDFSCGTIFLHCKKLFDRWFNWIPISGKPTAISRCPLPRNNFLSPPVMLNVCKAYRDFGW